MITLNFTDSIVSSFSKPQTQQSSSKPQTQQSSKYHAGFEQTKKDLLARRNELSKAKENERRLLTNVAEIVAYDPTGLLNLNLLPEAGWDVIRNQNQASTDFQSNLDRISSWSKAIDHTTGRLDNTWLIGEIGYGSATFGKQNDIKATFTFADTDKDGVFDKGEKVLTANYTNPTTGSTLNVAHDIDGLNESANILPEDLEAAINGDPAALISMSQSSFSTIGSSVSPEEQAQITATKTTLLSNIEGLAK